METSLVGIALGLAFGLLEGVLLEFRLRVLTEFTWSSHHVAWMAAVAYAMAFGGGAVVAWTALRVLRRATWAGGIVVGCCVAAGLASFLHLATYRRLHWVAIALVALGAGLQAGRRFHRLTGAAALTRRVAVWLGGVTALWAAVTFAGPLWRERRAINSLVTPPSEAKNVLLVVLDTVRGESLSLLGYDRPTSPELDRFAAQGAVFEQAIAPAPWTLPTHATLFTGRQPWEHQASFFRQLDARYPTLAEQFASRGYLTGAFVGNLTFANRQTGLARGFQRYEDFPVSLRQTVLSAEFFQVAVDIQSDLLIRADDRPNADQIVTRALAWMAEAERRQRPFFGFINFMDAHTPYSMPEEWRHRFEAGLPLRDRYDAAIAYLDYQLRELFDGLQRAGLLKRTVVVITADHGEHVGDHRLDGHGNSLYRQLLRVPLVIVNPGTAVASRIATPVALSDLPATILDLVGVPADKIPGRSFASMARGLPADTLRAPIIVQVQEHPLHRPWFRNDTLELWGAFDRGFHYIDNGPAGPELFRVADDPVEERNLAADPAFADRVAAFGRLIDSVRGRARAE